MIIELYDKGYIQHFSCNGCNKLIHQTHLRKVASYKACHPFGWVFVCNKCYELNN